MIKIFVKRLAIIFFKVFFPCFHLGTHLSPFLSSQKRKKKKVFLKKVFECITKKIFCPFPGMLVCLSVWIWLSWMKAWRADGPSLPFCYVYVLALKRGSCLFLLRLFDNNFKGEMCKATFQLYLQSSKNSKMQMVFVSRGNIRWNDWFRLCTGRFALTNFARDLFVPETFELRKNLH